MVVKLASDRPGLGGALRRAWIGYQLRLDEEMAAAGFADLAFPDGRVLHLCTRSDRVTASQIGRELGISRQGAGKIVAGLVDRGFVSSAPSPGDGRERVIVLSPRARAFLAAQRTAARRIEREVEGQLGAQAFEGLQRLLDALGGRAEQPRLREYLRRAARLVDDAEAT
jgi:DNA-binding MarR family transcriptional regulator